VAVARLARASRRERRGHRGRNRRGGTSGQGSPVTPMQRGWRHEYEDGEGRSLSKKDGGAAHQGGSGADEVADGAARWRFSEGSSIVEAEGLPTLTWRSGWRRAPTRCSSK
jgi:hypothetical protein